MKKGELKTNIAIVVVFILGAMVIWVYLQESVFFNPPDKYTVDMVSGVNGDDVVNLMDASKVKSFNGQTVTSCDECWKYDVNFDGSVNNMDFSLVRSLNGQSADLENRFIVLFLKIRRKNNAKES